MRRRAFRQHSSQKQSTSRNRCKTPVPRLSHVYVEYYFIGTAWVVAYLVREGYVDVLITTSGSLAEDVIKTAKPFKMGEWDSDEAALREQGINRLGNLFVPSDRYVWLEEYLYDFFEDFFRRQKVRTPTAFARELGDTLDDPDSVPEASSGQ